MTVQNEIDREAILLDIHMERERQIAKWGPQSHPDGTGDAASRQIADIARDVCDRRFKEGVGTWKDILTEEFFEALAEVDAEKLTSELIQISAVCVAWVEDIWLRAQLVTSH